MRENLIKILRNIDGMYNTTNSEKSMIFLEKIKLRTKKSDVLLNGTFDKQIRNNQITHHMATNLINDNTYAQEIAENLLKMAEIIFLEDVTDGIMLDTNEINTITKKDFDL
jgi:phosphate:Na+ symporter